MDGGAPFMSKKIGVSAPTLNNIANGSSNPSFKVLYKVFKHYPTLNHRWFFFGEKPMFMDKAPEQIDGYSKLNNVADVVAETNQKYWTKNTISKDENERIQRLEAAINLLNTVTQQQTLFITKLMQKIN